MIVNAKSSRPGALSVAMLFVSAGSPVSSCLADSEARRPESRTQIKK
jgi:hypothetical protein